MSFDKFLNSLCCCCSVKIGGFIIGWFYVAFTFLRAAYGFFLLQSSIELREKFLRDILEMEGKEGLIYEILRRAGFFVESINDVHKAFDDIKYLGISWMIYFSIFFVIDIIYLIGLYKRKHQLVFPMVIMLAVNIFAEFLLPSMENLNAFMNLLSSSHRDVKNLSKIPIYATLAVIFTTYFFLVVTANWRKLKTQSN